MYSYLHTCGSVLHLFILCFRFLSMVACVIVSMIVSMVACEKKSWNNLCCITFPCGERRINNSNNLIYMYNSNRPRSSFYKGTGHFRHNHFKDIVWYSSIAKMVLYVQCDLWTFCGALKTAFLDLYRFSMSTCKSRDGKLSYTLLRVKLFAPFCLSPPPPLFRPPPARPPGPLPQWSSCQWQKQKSIRDGPTNPQYGWGRCQRHLFVIHPFGREGIPWSTVSHCFSLCIFYVAERHGRFHILGGALAHLTQEAPIGGRILLLFLWLTSVCMSKAMKGSMIISPMKTS